MDLFKCKSNIISARKRHWLPTVREVQRGGVLYEYAALYMPAR